MTDSLGSIPDAAANIDETAAATPETLPLDAGAIQLAEGSVDVPMPSPGETVRIAVGQGQGLHFLFDPAAATGSQADGNVTLTINGGEVDLVGFRGAASGEVPVEITSADGSVISLADFLVALDISPEAFVEPAAGGAAAGALEGTVAPNQGAGFTPGQTPVLLASLDADGPVDPTALQYGLSEREPTLFDLIGEADAAGGALGSTVTTTIEGGEGGQGYEFDDPNYVGGTFSGGFEDWQPNQHIGDSSQSPMKLTVTLVPVDNEEIVSVTINNIPDGVTIWAPGQSVVGDGTNGITILAADLNNVWVEPVGNTDGDIVLNLSAQILDPDSGLTSLITGSATAIVDAVADQPEDVSGDAPAEVAIGTNVTFDVQAQFGDSTDGSEDHFLLVELPAGWGNPNGYPTESFAAGNSWGVEAGTYVILPATVDGSGLGTASLTLQAPTALDEGDGSETFYFDVVAKALDTAGDAELTGTNNVSYTPIQTDTEVPGIPVTVVKPYLTIDDVTVNEDAGTATFTVTLNGATGVAVALSYATGDGTAFDGAGETGVGIPDYSAASGNLQFPASSNTTQTVTITVPITDDNVFENPETFVVNLGGIDGTVVNLPASDVEGVGTILDDGQPPEISISDGTPLPQVEPGTSEDEPTQITFTVTLSNPSSQAVTVAYQTVTGSAIEGIDFENEAGTLTFAPGETSKTITIDVYGDNVDELLEQFTVELSAPTNATILDGEGVGQIADEDATPSLSISDGAPSPQVEPGTSEDAPTQVTFTVTLSNPSSQAVTVAYQTVTGSAIEGIDFENEAGLVTFAPGETSKTITIDVYGDNIDELLEQFTVELSAPTNATILDGEGVGQIADEDGTPSLSISDGSPSPQVEPGTSGDAPTQITFTVTLSNPSSQAVTVAYQTVTGSAIEGVDFENEAGLLTFAPGETSKTITIDVYGDNIDELLENFTVELSAPTNATILDGEGVGQIEDTDATPAISISDGSPSPQVEPGTSEDAPTQVTFTVTLSNPSSQAVTVAYQTVTGSAIEGIDFENEAGLLTFAPGETSKTITIDVYGDNIDELLENFTVELSAPTNATILDGEGVGQIEDTDATPAISISDGSPSPQVEPGTSEDAPTQVTFTVTLSNPSSQTVTVAYQTVTGSAVEGIDFENEAGLLIFAPGETSKTITIDVYGDNIDELLEQFTVELSAPTNATILDGEGVGQIADEDGTPSLSISDGSPLPQAEPGTSGDAPTQVTFTVTLSNPSSQAVTVAYQTVTGSAIEGVDFENEAGLLTFAPGETSKTITIDVYGDNIDELLENFTVELSSPTNASIADGSGTGQIQDNDATPVLTINNASANEGDALTFTLSLSNPSSGNIVLNLAAGTPGTGTPGVDYETTSFQYFNGSSWVAAGGPNGTQVTIPAGSTSLQVRIDSTEDTIDEANETFTLSATAAGGSAAVDTSDTGTGTINDDDAAPTLAINDVQVTEGDPIAGADDPATYVTFTVTKTGDTSQTVTVQYNVVEGSALEPQDYFSNGGASPLSGTLTFAAGETSKTITLKITDDQSAESTETFSVVLSNPTNATIADATGVGTVYDDDVNTPDAVDDTTSVTEGSVVNYNLMLILDKSGSMDNDDLDPGPGTLTRLQLAVDALKNMLAAYDAAAGTIQVQIVSFDAGAQGVFPTAGTFYTVEQAQAKLDQIAAAGAGGETDYDDATDLAADAFPNWPAESATQQNVVYFLSDGDPNPNDQGLDSSEQTAWQNALAAKGIETIAVGVGDGISDTTELAKVAYPAGNVILVENDTDLGAALLGTLPSTVTGNVIDNDSGGPDGFPLSPANIITNVVLVGGGTLVSSSQVGDDLTIVTSNGTLKIDLESGAYEYTAKPNSGGSFDKFQYTVQDAVGGQTDSAFLTIDIGERITIAEGAGSQNADGGGASDVITGSSLANVINGLGGNDVIDGKGGNDTLNGGTGNDRLIGGAGNDLMTGGAGADVFAFALGDQGTYSATTKTYTFQGVDQADNGVANAYEFEVSQSGQGSLGAVAGPGTGSTDLREASDFQYSQLFGDDGSRWTTTNANNSGHVVFWAQFDIAEYPSSIAQMELSINGRQLGDPGNSEDAQFGVWNYSTGSWQLLETLHAEGGDGTYNGTLTGNIANYLDANGKLTLALYNEDTTNGFAIDDVRVTVTSEAAPTVTDTITDFTVGLGGDVLDLDDLLPGTVNNGSSTNVIDNYIHFEKDGSNTNILIDHDGGGAFQPTLQVTLQGIDLTANSTLTDAQIIQSLIDNGNLAV